MRPPGGVGTGVHGALVRRTDGTGRGANLGRMAWSHPGTHGAHRHVWTREGLRSTWGCRHTGQGQGRIAT
eukprot:9884300-Alexandrium_andersonii.AAC.1